MEINIFLYLWLFTKRKLAVKKDRTGRYINFINVLRATTVNYLKKTGFFKEQNEGVSAQIYRVTLMKTWFFKRDMLSHV